MAQPHLEEYHPEPFSQRYVWHLPGWYAQKHPDEDWSETFAVWMTPGHDWRTAYAHWPKALAKLEYCDRTMAIANESDPAVTDTDHDEDVSLLAALLRRTNNKSVSHRTMRAVVGSFWRALTPVASHSLRDISKVH